MKTTVMYRCDAVCEPEVAEPDKCASRLEPSDDPSYTSTKSKLLSVSKRAKLRLPTCPDGQLSRQTQCRLWAASPVGEIEKAAT